MLEPGPINKQFFKPQTHPVRPYGPCKPCLATSGPNLKPQIHGPIRPNLKKKKKNTNINTNSNTYPIINTKITKTNINLCNLKKKKKKLNLEIHSFERGNEPPPPPKWRTQTTKAPSAVVSTINPTSGLHLTLTRPKAPLIITSLSILTIPCSILTILCSSVTNSNHHMMRVRVRVGR